MERDELVLPEMGLGVPAQREGVVGDASVDGDSGESAEVISFGPLANPNRLRLGANLNL